MAQRWNTFRTLRKQHLDAPPSESDVTDEPIVLDPPTSLKLYEEDIRSVVWCTGFTGDFSWLSPDLRDAAGEPRRDVLPGRYPVSGTQAPLAHPSVLRHPLRLCDAEPISDAVKAHRGAR